MSDDREKAMPEADEAKQQEGDDVEGHTIKPNIKPAAEAAATEEGPDVEGHTIKPNIKP